MLKMLKDKGVPDKFAELMVPLRKWPVEVNGYINVEEGESIVGKDNVSRIQRRIEEIELI